MRTITTILLTAISAFAGDMAVMSKRTLTLDGARTAIDAVIAEAKKSNAGGVIAVVDEGGNLIALNRIDGSFAAGANVAIGKARTAALFQKPTRFFEEVIAKGRTSMVALNDFTPLQGGVPIIIDGQIVGAVGVSGANSAAQDEEFARSGVAAVMTRLQAKVTFFDADAVRAGFDKGAVLFDNSDKYMVHASRRDKPGQVEVHNRDADIVYVLNGTATLVTGGELRDGKTTAPDEVRGTQLEGGDERQLKPGDAIIIPANVPHWFKQVSDPFQYYVVKVR